MIDLYAEENFINAEMSKYLDNPYLFVQDGVEVTSYTDATKHLFLSYFKSLYEDTIKPRSYFNKFHEVMHLPDPKWIIDGIIPENGMGSIYGGSGCGKTFLTLDMAYCIAHGVEWFGLKVRQHPVIYMCLEGNAGFRKRIRALSIKYGQKQFMENARLFPDMGFSITDDYDVGQLVDNIKLEFPDGCLVIVDTMNAASAGLSENDSKDMSSLLSHAKRIKEECNSMLLLVHHTGKDASRGMRGHSSLFAAMDVVLEVKDDDGVKQWSATKSKDGITEKAMTFKLNVVAVFQSDNQSTSCVIKPGDDITTKERESNKYANAIIDALSSLMKNGNGLIFGNISYDGVEYSNKTMFTESDFRKEVKEQLSYVDDETDQKTINQGIRRQKEKFLNSGVLIEYKNDGVNYVGFASE